MARRSGASERFIHDAANGSRAAAALGAASQAMINLASCARRIGLVRHRSTHILVAEDVAGTNNHLNKGPATNWYDLKLSIDQAIFRCKD
jgi:hypothetical protein